MLFASSLWMEQAKKNNTHLRHHYNVVRLVLSRDSIKANYCTTMKQTINKRINDVVLYFIIITT